MRPPRHRFDARFANWALWEIKIGARDHFPIARAESFSCRFEVEPCPTCDCRLSGRITASDLPGRVPLVITLANPNWPNYRRTWHVNATAGRFSAGLTPPISGTLTISYDGSTVVRAAIVSVGHVAVTPRITATFRRSHGSIIATGSFSPTDGPSATLLWQAKSPRGGGWLNICRDQDAIHARHGGFTGRCHLTLNPGLELRLVYRPGVGGAYGPAASPGSSAR